MPCWKIFLLTLSSLLPPAPSPLLTDVAIPRSTFFTGSLLLAAHGNASMENHKRHDETDAGRTESTTLDALYWWLPA